MNLYLSKTPIFIRTLLPQLTWQVNTNDRKIYLTFDDGPTPKITPWVLDQLDKYKAKATFFCIGKNVKSYPEIFNDIKERGHAVGNHTYNHLSGWNVSRNEYWTDIEKADTLIKSSLFRPHYGKINPRIIKRLKSKYQLIMWDVLSGDFDLDLNPDQCLKNVLSNCTKGSIIVLHDSVKSSGHLKSFLPQLLKELKAQSYDLTRLPY